MARFGFPSQGTRSKPAAQRTIRLIHQRPRPLRRLKSCRQYRRGRCDAYGKTQPQTDPAEKHRRRRASERTKTLQQEAQQKWACSRLLVRGSACSLFPSTARMARSRLDLFFLDLLCIHDVPLCAEKPYDVMTPLVVVVIVVFFFFFLKRYTH